LSYYPFPPATTPGPFTLSGNPIGGTGFRDGLGTAYSFIQGDRRIVLASGPFSLAPGDTQEVVIATVAGIGSDRLSSITLMKHNDSFAQSLFQNLLNPITSIVNEQCVDAENPTSFRLSQNYPNPFNPSTIIHFYLAGRSKVRITVFNLLGQEIVTLAEGVFASGPHSAEWNAQGASGVYFYRLEGYSIDNPTHRFLETRKMVLMR